MLGRVRRGATRLLRLNRDFVASQRERRRALALPPAFWADLPRVVAEEQEPVFVLSTGRCGTRLLTDLFELTPSVLCYHAPKPELMFIDRLAYEQGAANFEAFETAIWASRFELMADCVIRGRRYIETNQRITFFAAHLYALLPKARFIHLVRHPGAFVRSGVLRHYYGGRWADIGRIRPTTGEAAERWEDMTIYERCAWLWDETNRFIEAFKEARDPGRILTVKAEDVFMNPDTTAAIFRHCGLSPPATARVRAVISKPVNTGEPEGKLPPYGAWPEERKHAVRRWAGEGASLYGYEL